MNDGKKYLCYTKFSLDCMKLRPQGGKPYFLQVDPFLQY